MKSKMLWTLVVLNAMLIVALMVQVTTPVADAQARRPADYIMVPGDVAGGQGAAVYMIDTTNGLLGAMSYDPSRNELHAMTPIDLNRLFEAAAPPAVGPGRRP
jgi:hypothetical protein